jgi:hypothetical protein
MQPVTCMLVIIEDCGFTFLNITGTIGAVSTHSLSTRIPAVHHGNPQQGQHSQVSGA